MCWCSFFFCIFGSPSLQWKEAKPDELMDSKLRCVFEMPVENEKTVSPCCSSTFLLASPHSHFLLSLHIWCQRNYRESYVSLLSAIVFKITLFGLSRVPQCIFNCWYVLHFLSGCWLSPNITEWCILLLLSVPISFSFLLSFSFSLFLYCRCCLLISLFIPFSIMSHLSFTSTSPSPCLSHALWHQLPYRGPLCSFSHAVYYCCDSSQTPHSCRDIISSWYEPSLRASWTPGGKKDPW